MVLFAPSAAFAGVPPHINRVAGGEIGNRAGMASAQGLTVVEIVTSRAGADIQSVFQVLTAMPPVKVTAGLVKVAPGVGELMGGGKVVPPPILLIVICFSGVGELSFPEASKAVAMKP